mmetsp:Transcript_20448/g.52467  ORF Transcript_20448/g.52467 Transcript_20448/m.52467 type:complete len:117 (+) Transcript_20448:3164-3514(+)
MLPPSSRCLSSIAPLHWSASCWFTPPSSFLFFAFLLFDDVGDAKMSILRCSCPSPSRVEREEEGRRGGNRALAIANNKREKKGKEEKQEIQTSKMEGCNYLTITLISLVSSFQQPA